MTKKKTIRKCSVKQCPEGTTSMSLRSSKKRWSMRICEQAVEESEAEESDASLEEETAKPMSNKDKNKIKCWSYRQNKKQQMGEAEKDIQIEKAHLRQQKSRARKKQHQVMPATPVPMSSPMSSPVQMSLPALAPIVSSPIASGSASTSFSSPPPPTSEKSMKSHEYFRQYRAKQRAKRTPQQKCWDRKRDRDIKSIKSRERGQDIISHYSNTPIGTRQSVRSKID